MPMPLTKPSIENESIMARYPFLPQGSVFLKFVLEKNGITVEDLIEAPWLEEVRARGRIRLLESVMHKEGVDAATTIDCLLFVHHSMNVCWQGGLKAKLAGRTNSSAWIRKILLS
jgi:hypothetical protein